MKKIFFSSHGKIKYSVLIINYFHIVILILMHMELFNEINDIIELKSFEKYNKFLYFINVLYESSLKSYSLNYLLPKKEFCVHC